MIRNVLIKFGSLRLALAASVGFPLIFAATAFAQAPPPPPTGPVTAEAERVIVTGSNIPTAQEESSMPVTTYTAQWLQKSGANAPVEGLRQLPSFVGNAATETNSNGGSGAASVNLRGLGSQNVVILINGRRVSLGESFDFVDVNFIPISGLQRVEVLKDGASAIYGSDAVAGVVDFVMYGDRRLPPYEGAEFEVRYGTTTDTDANTRQAWIRGGVTGLDGKVAIFGSAEYYNRAGLFARDRTISATANQNTNTTGIEINPNIGITGLGLGGLNQNSPTFAGRVDVSDPNLSFNGLLVLTDLSNVPTSIADYRVFDNPSGSDPARFNFRAFSPAIPAIEKSIEYVSGRYKIFDDALVVYGDMLYGHYRQNNALAGAPFSVRAPEALLSPFNPFGIDPATGENALVRVRYRLQQELGNRTSVFDKDLWHWVVGAKGDLDFADNAFISHVGYDTGITYERFEDTRIDGGDATFTGIVNEIAAGNFNPFIGQNAPTIGVAPIYDGAGNQIGTAPYNNVAAANRAAYIGHSLFHQKDFNWDVTLNAHLFPNLWNGGIDIAGGYVHRWHQEHSIPDPVQAQGDQLGFNQAPNFKFHQEVDAYFGEIKIPFVTSTMNVPFVTSFEVDYAYRFEEFTDTDLTNPSTHLSGTFDNGGTNRVTVRWQPIPDLLLRGTWGQSFRSPFPGDLFTPTFQNFPLLNDPVKQNTLQPSEGEWVRGNTELKPEDTESWTAGLVYSPKFVPGFTLTADWYQIFTQGLILDADSFAQLLLTQGVIDPDGFGNGSGTIDGPGGTGLGITRDNFGNLIAVDTTNSNAGKRFVQGIDVTASYQLPTTNFGQFTFTLGWNYFFTYKVEPIVGFGTHNFLGDFSQAFPLTPGAIPFNKGFVRLEWEYKLGPGILDFVAQGNYIGDYEDDPNFILGNDLVADNPGTNAEPNFILHRRVSDYMTLDLQLSYEFVKPPLEAAQVPGYAKEGKDFKSSKQPVAPAPGVVETGSFFQRMLWGTKVTAGVVNAFDRMPPSLLGNFNDGYDTNLYTIRNRFWYVALSKKF